jgi:hypothetical protein
MHIIIFPLSVLCILIGSLLLKFWNHPSIYVNCTISPGHSYNLAQLSMAVSVFQIFRTTVCECFKLKQHKFCKFYKTEGVKIIPVPQVSLFLEALLITNTTKMISHNKCFINWGTAEVLNQYTRAIKHIN